MWMQILMKMSLNAKFVNQNATVWHSIDTANTEEMLKNNNNTNKFNQFRLKN